MAQLHPSPQGNDGRSHPQDGNGGAARLVHVETFGCQMNEYDTEIVRSLLKARGFTFTEDRERADVILMNTCAIREHAHNRVYGHLA